MTFQFTVPVLSRSWPTYNYHRFTLPKDHLESYIRFLLEEKGARLAFRTLFVVDERKRNNHFTLFILFSVLDPSDSKKPEVLEIEAIIPEDDPNYPALTPHFPGAEWGEREIYEMFGVKPVGLDCQPLVLHQDWPHGRMFPMQKDFDVSQHIEIGLKEHHFNQPQIEGSHQVAVGPIHAGIIEPGHLRFTVTGEKIHQFDAQLFYTHKGLEKMAEGKTLEEGLKLAEHVCGMCAYAHSTVFCQAVEALAEVNIPVRANYLRGILLELERISSHLFDLSAICAAGGLPFGSVQAARFREMVLRLISDLTGHRFFRGINRIGGLVQDIPNAQLQEAQKNLSGLLDEFQTWEQLVLNHEGLLDRLETTGFLSEQRAAELALVGPPARGSGIRRDIRHDLAYGVYVEHPPEVIVFADGDVLARTRVRIEEVKASVRLIETLIRNLPGGLAAIGWDGRIAALNPTHSAVESAKGDLIHWLMVDENQRIERWHFRSAPYMNWRAVVQATMGNNIVPDGPLVNKSFNLCYACSDK